MPSDPPLTEPSAENDRLAPALRAADRGDFAQAARLARALAGDGDPSVSARARALLAQLRPDPVVLAVMAGTALLILALVAIYFVGP